MNIAWGKLWEVSRGRLKAAWLITAGLLALYMGVLQPTEEIRGISTSRATGLGATSWEPISLWHRPRLAAILQKGRAEGIIGGIQGMPASGGAGYMTASMTDAAETPPPPQAEGRKMIRTGSLDLVVKNPRESSENIRQIAERAGGFLVSSEVYGSEEDSNASVTVRVPAARFEEVRAAVRKLGLRVEGDKLEAQDVTMQYVDQAARLHNLHAQEAQYLGILKQARTVKDTVEVSDKLDEVRGQIEQQQGEFNALSKQVETVELAVSLRAEADTQVFGLHWRPLYQLKYSAREGIDSIGDYTAKIVAFLFYLPTVLLWLATILIVAAVAWRLLRWAGKILFLPRVKAA